MKHNCQHLRQQLLQHLNQTGGHLAAGLGVVELTVALHTCFDLSKDVLLWDTGHQAIVHKMLSGRLMHMPTLRKVKGLTPFPKKAESPFDWGNGGHAGNAVGLGVGYALGAKQLNTKQQVIVVLGDGGLTCGQTFEALNHLGSSDCNLLLIYNNNKQSIGENIGALHEQNTHDFFAALNLKTSVAIDGHDIQRLIQVLQNYQNSKGIQVISIITEKGHGFRPAELDPVRYHGVKAGFLTPVEKPSQSISFTQGFSEWIVNQAVEDPKLIAITPAMKVGSGLTKLNQKYPQRVIDVAIAEQHSVTLTAGLAHQGLKPILAIYATFLQRAFDQLIQDLAMDDVDCLLAIDRAGLVGEDGPTHSGCFDLSMLLTLPTGIVLTPADLNELHACLTFAYQYPGLAAVRYPRGSAKCGFTQQDAFSLGKARLLREGQNIALLAFGPLVYEALAAAKVLDATVIDMRFAKPLDEKLLLQTMRSHQLMVSIEDHMIQNGCGQQIGAFLLQHDYKGQFLALGLDKQWSEQGPLPDVYKFHGLDGAGIISSIKRKLATKTCLSTASGVKSATLV